MASASKASGGNKVLKQMIIFCLLAAIGWIIPPVNGLTPAGAKMLGVLMAVIYGWTATSEAWPSMLAFILILFTGVTDLPGLLAVSWGNDITMFTVLIFVLMAFMEKTGTATFVAAWLMTRKFLNGHPFRLLGMVFFVAWVLCTFVQTVAGVLITWSIVYQMLKILDYKPYEKFSTIVLFGVIAMGALSLSSLPWGGNALVILNAYAAQSGTPVDMMHYLCYSLPFVAFSLLGYLGLCRWVFGLDVSRLKGIKIDFFTEEQLTCTPERKTALLATLALIILIMIPSTLPAELGITKALASVGLSAKMLMVFVGLSLVRVKGEHIFNFAELATKGTPWNMIMMTVSIMAFVGLLATPATGLSAFLGAMLSKIFADISLVWFFIAVVLITIVLTNITINMVVAMLMITVTMPIAAGLGLPQEQMVYLITVCCTIAFALPAASPAGMLLFANSQWIKPTDAYKYAVPTIIVMGIVALAWNVILFMF